MSDARFRLGDAVQLQWGGPVMRVEAILANDVYRCGWADPAGGLHTDTFFGRSLKVVATAGK